MTPSLDLDALGARRMDGSVGFAITVDGPMVDELPPLQVGAVLVLELSSGHVAGLGSLD